MMIPDARYLGSAMRRSRTATPLVVEGPFRITAQTPGIDDGVELWTPSVGDLILAVGSIARANWDLADQIFVLSEAANALQPLINGVGIDLDVWEDTVAPAVVGAHDYLGVDLRLDQGFIQWTLAEVIRARPVMVRPRVPGSTVGAVDVFALVLPNPTVRS